MIKTLSDVLYGGEKGTDDAVAWLTVVVALFFLVLIRAKRHERTHIGWGVLIAPLVVAVASAIYAFVYTRAGMGEAVPMASALLIFGILFQQLVVRAIPKWLLVQTPIILAVLCLAITLFLDALLNFWLSINQTTAPDTLGYIGNTTSWLTIWLLGAALVAIFIAFWVVLIRGIVRKVRTVNAGTP